MLSDECIKNIYMDGLNTSHAAYEAKVVEAHAVIFIDQWPNGENYAKTVSQSQVEIN